MHKPPRNKQVIEVANKIVNEGPPPAPQEGSREWLESKGWAEYKPFQVPNPERRWLDPRTAEPGGAAWYYSFTEAVDLQLQRDGKRPTDW